MEPNYIDIEALVQKARQERNQILGELLSAGWRKFSKLFSGDLPAGHQGAVLWRVLPP